MLRLVCMESILFTYFKDDKQNFYTTLLEKLTNINHHLFVFRKKFTKKRKLNQTWCRFNHARPIFLFPPLPSETMPNAQRTRGLSSSYQSNLFRSYHKFKNKSWSNFIFRSVSASKSQPNIGLLTKLKIRNMTKPSFRISTKIQLHNLYKTSAAKY